MNLRIDTRNKKPKVYNIAVLSGIVLVVQILLFVIGGERSIPLSCLVMALYALAVTALLIRAFFLQIQYNPYSYNTIIYFGFALFTFSLVITYALLYAQLVKGSQQYVGPAAIGWLLGSAKAYTLFTFPFLFMFSVALIISNVSLIRHEGFRFVNVLGILLAFLLLGGEVLIFALDYATSGSVTEVMLHDLFTNFLAAVYLYVECMLLGTMMASAITCRHEPEKDKDFIIILGCGIRKDGTPTPLLRGRMDRALRFAKEQEERTGKKAVFVLSGGQGPDECISEAESMKGYMLEQGIEADRLILEDRSTDTAENMRFSKEKIFAIDPNAKVAFCTTNYHVFRAGLKARRVKMRAIGMGSRSKWYFWPNAAVREFVGLLTEHRIKQGLILVGLIVIYSVLTVLYYRYV